MLVLAGLGLHNLIALGAPCNPVSDQRNEEGSIRKVVIRSDPRSSSIYAEAPERSRHALSIQKQSPESQVITNSDPDPIQLKVRDEGRGTETSGQPRSSQGTHRRAT